VTMRGKSLIKGPGNMIGTQVKLALTIRDTRSLNISVRFLLSMLRELLSMRGGFSSF
jgi:hypothetical protein